MAFQCIGHSVFLQITHPRISCKLVFKILSLNPLFFSVSNIFLILGLQAQMLTQFFSSAVHWPPGHQFTVCEGQCTSSLFTVLPMLDFSTPWFAAFRASLGLKLFGYSTVISKPQSFFFYKIKTSIYHSDLVHNYDTITLCFS